MTFTTNRLVAACYAALGSLLAPDNPCMHTFDDGKKTTYFYFDPNSGDAQFPRNKILAEVHEGEADVASKFDDLLTEKHPELIEAWRAVVIRLIAIGAQHGFAIAELEKLAAKKVIQRDGDSVIIADANATPDELHMLTHG